MKAKPARNKFLLCGVCVALLFFRCATVAANDVPNGCLQQLLDAQAVRLSTCGTVDNVDATRTGSVAGGAQLYLVQEFGGSGVFGSMVAFTSDGGMLRRAFVIYGGDRCDNGIKSARMSGDGFVVERHQTPLLLGSGAESCATCCAGVKEERYNAAGVLLN